MKTVCFVGISDKEGMEPFDSQTKSGMLVDQMISLMNVNAIKINYVSFPPLNEKGKLRYPTKEELQNSFPFFREQIDLIQPDVIVVFGNLVKKEFFHYHFCLEKTIFVYHPSYVYVYKRDQISFYVNDVVGQIKRRLSFGE